MGFIHLIVNIIEYNIKEIYYRDKRLVLLAPPMLSYRVFFKKVENILNSMSSMSYSFSAESWQLSLAHFGHIVPKAHRRKLWTIFSSADLSVKLSFCDGSASVVCAGARPQFTYFTSSKKQWLTLTSNLVGMYLRWVSTKFVQMVTVHWILDFFWIFLFMFWWNL